MGDVALALLLLPGFLLAQVATLQRLASKYGMAPGTGFARRFIAGETVDEAVAAAAALQQQGLLRPVHLVKVSHHGSHNGTDEDHLDTLIPPQSHDGRPRHALVSTHDGDWDSVPDRDTLSVYASRCILHDTRQAERGAPVEIRFPA